MIIDMLKQILSPLIASLKSTIMSFNSQFGEFILIGVALALGWLLLSYVMRTWNKGSKWAARLMLGALILIIFALA